MIKSHLASVTLGSRPKMDFGVRGSLGVSPAVLESVFRGLDLSPPTVPVPLRILTVPASSLYQPQPALGVCSLTM